MILAMIPHVFPSAVLVLTLAVFPGRGADEFKSCSPQRPLPQPSAPPLTNDPAHFADPLRGDNTADGTKEHPWKTIHESLPRLNAGDTLYLRGGSYFEHIYCAVAGTAEKSITIRSYIPASQTPLPISPTAFTFTKT